MVRLGRKLTLVWLLGLLLTSPVIAQQSADEATLRAQQQSLVQQLVDDPANLDLMFEHAKVSIALKDYEAAITTLERLLIFDQDLPQVRLELAIAYFNLGSYEVANLYFEQVLSDDTVPNATRELVARYQSEIGSRKSTHQTSLVVNLGATFSTNANLGPPDSQVTIGGNSRFFLRQQGTAQSDFGARVLVYGRHAYDLGRTNDDAWLTDVSLFSVRYDNIETGNVFAVRGRTGPRLNLSTDAGGAKVRPYGEVSYINVADRSVYLAGFVGAEFTAPVSENWTAFGDATLGYLNFEAARNSEDARSVRLLAGGAYQASRRMIGRAALVAQLEQANADFNSSKEFGARFTGEYRYDSGLYFVEGLWSVSAFADARYRWYDEPDPFIDPNVTRKELDLRGGIGHRFGLTENFGLQLDVEAFLRGANIQNFDLNNLSVTLSAQYRM